MKNDNIKCSKKEHKEINALIYCQECRKYMCNKCINFHSNLFENHHTLNFEKDKEEIFTGICPEDNHYEYKYYCKNHNKLCCVACIAKIKGEGNGQHKDCEICFIKAIKDEKKSKLKENIKILEELSNTFEQSIKELKIIIEKINEDKEKLKTNIQQIFTKIRTTLNEREDNLLLKVDEEFNKLYFEGDIKKIEKLPNEIKRSLAKGKINENDWEENNKLNSIIFECINIENNIKNINSLNEVINQSKLSNQMKVKFSPKEEEINKFLEKIISFGNIYCDNFNSFKFKKCPNNINEKRKYIVTGEKGTILTKTGAPDYWMGTICENKLEKNETKWKIKILKSRSYFIMVGVAPIDFDVNSSLHVDCGWYIYCINSNLYSGPPFNYVAKSTNLGKIKDEIILIMNLEKRTLKFIINNEDKGDSYTNIPVDKPLFPAVCLYNINDSVEILEC